MTRRYLFRLWVLTVAGCLLHPTYALAGAKEDLSISISGACSGGGTAFSITNKNPSNGIHATVTQATVASGKTSVTTLDISFQPKEQKPLGCSSQGAAGNFLVRWQVQSAQYQ